MNLERINILGLFCAVMLGVYIWLSTPLATGLTVGQRFDWPDEMANHFFATQYAQQDTLAVAEPLNAIAQNQIHPRSTNVANGYILPGSFLGMPMLYGLLARVFSVHMLLYFTPIFGVLAAIALYAILRRLFTEYTARLSAILLLLHPAWWYYSVTSMLPNVPFVSFVLFALYFIVRPVQPHTRVDVSVSRQLLKRSLWPNALAGICLGVAIAIRPSEIVWVGILVLSAMLFAKKHLTAWKVILILLFAGVTVFPTFYQQQQLYGDWSTTGYAQLQDESSESCTSCEVTKALLLPFGLHPTQVGINFWHHFLSRLWPWTLMAILGAAAFLSKKSRAPGFQYGYLFVALFLTIFLAIFYGSWEFTDKLTVALNTLGVSYVRYWLPIYIVSLPFAALGIQWFTLLVGKRARGIVVVALVMALGFFSVRLTLWQKPDSILPVRERIASYKQIAVEVNQETEQDSVIITVRKDKVFFPDRKVIHSFDALSLRPDLQTISAELLDVVPVYYYALGPEPMLELESGIALTEVQRFNQEVLYKLSQ